MKEYRLLMKVSKFSRDWWAPEDAENGWFPYEPSKSLDYVLELFEEALFDCPGEKLKIQEREIQEWRDCEST